MLRELTEILSAGGIENAEREAQWLLDAAATDSEPLPMVGRGPVPFAFRKADDQIAGRALKLAQRRADGEPLQYLTGIAAFRHLVLRVGPGVLVPRPESEIVTELAIERLPKGGTLVDIGTGSGCLALAVAHERPDASVYATEISDAAMKWARINRDAIAPRVQLFTGDLFEAVPVELKGGIDVLASNPPYIGEREREGLPKDVVDHEPGVAVFGGEDGLEIIRRLVSEAPEWITPGGWIVLEISAWQKEDMLKLLPAAGFEQVVVEPDLAGRDRIALGRHPGD